jgi:hypothetical protein
MSNKTAPEDAPIDFVRVTLVAKSYYADYVDMVKADTTPDWDSLTQEVRDHYITKALRTFGISIVKL